MNKESQQQTRETKCDWKIVYRRIGFYYQFSGVFALSSKWI